MSTAEYHSGATSLVVTNAGAGAGVASQTHISVDPLTTWTGSIWVKGPVGRTVKLTINEYTSADVFVGSTFATVVLDGTWQKLVASRAVGSGAPRIALVVQDDGAGTYSLYLDDVQIDNVGATLPWWTAMADASGNGYNGIIEYGAVPDPSLLVGAPGKAMRSVEWGAGAVSASVFPPMGAAPLTANSPVSVAFWVRLDSDPGGIGYDLVTFGPLGVGLAFNVAVTKPAAQVTIHANYYDDAVLIAGPGSTPASVGAGLVLGEPAFIVVTYEADSLASTGHGHRIYVNGVLNVAVDTTGILYYTDADPANAVVSLGGSYFYGQGHVTLDEVAIFTRRLSDQEIANLHVTGAPPPQSPSVAPPTNPPPPRASKVERLLDMLPPYESGDAFVQAVVRAYANEFERIEDAAISIREAMFPTQVGEPLLPTGMRAPLASMWETLLGLAVAPAGATLGDRENKIVAHIRKRRSARGADWVANLTEALGTTPWSYQEGPASYQVTIRIPYASGSLSSAQVLALAREITPAHLDLLPAYDQGFLIEISLIGVEPL